MINYKASKHRWFFIVPICIIIILGLYIAVKPYGYKAIIKTNANAGTIDQTLKLWSLSLPYSNMESLQNNSNLRQTVELKEGTFLVDWKFDTKVDSLTAIEILVNRINNNFYYKMSSILNISKVEKEVSDMIINFSDVLKSHLDKINVTVKGPSNFEERFCGCVYIETNQLNKAKSMMANYGFLDNFFVENNIALKGRPLIEIERWNRNNDSLYLNFCYPIEKVDSLPKNERLRYKLLPERNVLKAIYNGNYITSDRAWYDLIDYAEFKDIEIIQQPMEIFNSNPNMGGDESTWEAEIYMPISN